MFSIPVHMNSVCDTSLAEELSSLVICLKNQQEERYEALASAADIEQKFTSAQEKYETVPSMRGFDAQTPDSQGSRSCEKTSVRKI